MKYTILLTMLFLTSCEVVEWSESTKGEKSSKDTLKQEDPIIKLIDPKDAEGAFEVPSHPKLNKHK